MINDLPLFLRNGRVIASSSLPETYIGKNFYFKLSEAADVSGYKRATTQPSGGVETSVTQTNTGTTDTLLATFISDGGQPGVDSIPMGTVRWHVHASTAAANQIVRLKMEVYKRTLAGVETKLREGYSDAFSGTSVSEIEWALSDPNSHPIELTDRIVWKLYSARVDGPTSCDVTVYFEGESHTAYTITTITTGAGVSLNSNTIWGRSSTGAAGPKAVSDFSFDLLSQTSNSAWRSALGAGTVSSVALSLPGIFSVSGTPVTTTGTLSASLVSQTAKTFLAAPNGAAGVPVFRAIAATDIPVLNQSTTGSAATLTTARTINGTSFNGSANITTANWGTARTLTIGSTSKSVNGSTNYTWTLAEIGAQAALGFTPVNKAGDVNVGTLSFPNGAVAVQAAGGGAISSEAAGNTLTVKPGADEATVPNVSAFVVQGFDSSDRFVIPEATSRPAVLSNTGLSIGGFTAWHAGNFNPSSKLDAGATSAAATKLETARTISISGDMTWSVSFDGTANVTAAGTLTNVVTAGTATKITYDSKGRVTAGASLVASDIPALDWTKITTGKPTTLSGYGITDATPSSHVGSGGTSHAAATTTTAGFMSAADKTKLDAIAAGAQPGTVTSVGISLPTIFSVTGSPVTSSGTLTATLASQTAKTFLAAPNGAAGAPTFRAIVASDIPVLNQNTTGSAATLTTARTINGTSFNGSANITTANWGTSRNITIGGTTKAVNGATDVTWTLAEIGALAAASYTAADVLAKTLTVDGAGSGLDSDLLDGQEGTYYAKAADLNLMLPKAGGTMTGGIEMGTNSVEYNQTLIYSPSSTNDVLNIRRFSKDYTLINVMAPPQQSWGGARESTLALCRGDGNEYFLDLYNMDYGSTDAGNNMDYGDPKMGMRLQRRGTGIFTPFFIEYSAGAEEARALEIYPRTSTGAINDTLVKVTKDLEVGRKATLPVMDRGNGFIAWTGEASVTSATSVALLDPAGQPLSPTKTYKVAACNIDSSAQRGAVVLFVGDGASFVSQVVYEQGTTSSNVQLYLNAGVPTVSVFGGSGPYRVVYLIEEIPNFGTALSEFGILQRIMDAPSDGTAYVRKDGAWVAAGGGSSDPPTFVAKDANYTFVASDAGLGYAVTGATGRTYTIPSGVFSSGTKIWVAAQSTGTITLARGSGLTLRLAGSTSNSNRIVGAYGMACIYFISSTVAVVYGSGIG